MIIYNFIIYKAFLYYIYIKIIKHFENWVWTSLEMYFQMLIFSWNGLIKYTNVALKQF